MRGMKSIALVLLCVSLEISATALLGAAADEHNAAPAERRRLRLHHLHTGEDIDVVYKVGDQYVPNAVAALDQFLRDHRTGDQKAFAPSGKVIVTALASLRKGGVVAINAIHLDQMPAFDYDKLLWGERQIRSVANMTRKDAHDFLALAQELKLRPQTAVFSLDQANQALLAVKDETEEGSAVIVP